MRQIALLLFIFIFCSISLFSDNLLAGAGTGNGTTASSTYADVASTSTINMANVDKVLVIATFTDESTEQAQVKRTHSFRIRDNSTVNVYSGNIERYLQQERTGDKGIGSLVYVFDVSGITSGTRIYTLQHKVDQNKNTYTNASIVAIPLNSDTSPYIQLPNSSASISAAVSTTNTSYVGVTGLSTSSISMNNGGDMLIVASINAGSASALANGSWILQKQYNTGSFQNIGTAISRSIDGTNDRGVITLFTLIENQNIGNYTFRVAHKANSLDVLTINSCIAVVGLNYNKSGSLRKFNADISATGSIATGNTSPTSVTNLNSINADGTNVLLLGQFGMSSTAESIANYSLSSSGGSTTSTIMRRYLSGSSDSGAGGNVALVSGLTLNDDYSFNLNHYLTASGTTLTSTNSTLIALQLSDFEDDVLPVTLSSFTAAYINNQSTLNWTTQSESQNSGWNILRNTTPEYSSAAQINSSIIDGYGTTSEPSNYSFIDEADLDAGQTYWYWLESISYSGASEYFGPIAVEVINQGDLEETPSVESAKGLLPNYPNPFNPETSIMFNLAENEVAEYLEIYNMKGQKIDSIQHPDNPQSWNGTDSAGNQLASGVYAYILKTNMGQYKRKMVLTK